jgi:hypothetical protein
MRLCEKFGQLRTHTHVREEKKREERKKEQ